MSRNAKFSAKKSKQNWKNKAKMQAKKGNYQDAAMDNERSKSEGTISNGTGNNDPSWYIPTAQMMKDVSSLSFDYFTGSAITLTDSSSVLVKGKDVLPLPGLLVYYIAPTVGDTDEHELAPVNVAMQSLFTTMRQKISGTSYYEAPNILSYILAMDSLYSYYSFLVRAYGVMQRYSVLNRYMPEAIISAMGLDYKDLFFNLSDFRTYINQFAYRLSSLPVPDGIDYMARHKFMYENIYKDSETVKSQLFMYSPVGFYKYSEDSFNEDGFPVTSLVLHPLLSMGTKGYNCVPDNSGEVTNQLTLRNLITYGEELMQPILGSDTIRFITADIIKVFGSEMYKIAQIAETYTVEPIYNKEVLMQFENAFIHPEPQQVTGNQTFKWGIDEHIAINESYLTSKYAYTPTLDDLDVHGSVYEGFRTSWNTLNELIKQGVLNFHHENVTSEEIMVATRLSSICGGTLDAEVSSTVIGNYNITDCGSEVVLGARIYSFPLPGVNDNKLMGTKIHSLMITSNNGSVYSKLPFDIPPLWSAFDWAPSIRFGAADLVGGVAKIYAFGHPLLEIDNFTVVSRINLKEMNKIALLAQLNIRSSDILR